MPGICGIVARPGSPEIAGLLPEMLDALRYHPWYLEQQYTDTEAGVALGRSTLGFLNTAEQPVTSQDATRLAIMDGELYQPQLIRRQLEAHGHSLQGESHAELLLAGYAWQGEAFFRQLHGSFVAAIWEPATRRLLLVNDRFGMRPLYYTQAAGKLLFASNLRALVADPAVSRAPSWCGLSQFFTFGQYLNDETSLEAVKVLPAAACFVYDAERQQLTAAQYATLEADALTTADPAQWLDQIDTRFKAAVDRRTHDTPGLGISLSGGLDARTILGVIDHPQVSLQSVCLGMAGSQDHQAAAAMAQLVGCPHYRHLLDTQFLSNYREHLEQMVELTDGQYLSQCIVMPTLPVYLRLGVKVLLRGHAGELMHMQKAYSYSLDKEALAIRDAAQLESWLFRHLQAYLLDGVETPLLAQPHQRDMAPLARESLAQSLVQAEAVEPPLQRIWHHFVTQRLRREMTLSLMKIGSVAEVRVPYLDHDLVPLLLAIPPEMKLGETIQQYILQRRRPEFLRVVNVNTGTSIGASPVRQKVASLRNRVFAKLGLPGYQPYERLGLWLRRELAPLVQEILLSDECLERGIFNPDTLRQVVARHLQNRYNHTYLLMALMISELGQRRLAGDGVSTSHVALRDQS